MYVHGALINRIIIGILTTNSVFQKYFLSSGFAELSIQINNFVFGCTISL
jgi:hypothetical protein